MLGAIAGDIIGSVYEFSNHRNPSFTPLFHPKARFTDDTVCTVAVADALINDRNPAESLRDWGRRYWSTGGWGQRFARWLASNDASPYGSLGNGGAMRVGPAGLLAKTEDDAIRLADHVTSVTHDHPDGILSARAVAVAIFMARANASPDGIRNRISQLCGYDLSESPAQLREYYQRTERAADSVPQALICALAADSFEAAIRDAVSIGGDADTLGAIAGSVAEARFGMPESIAREAWNFLPNDMRVVMQTLYRIDSTSF